jgi:hypothetical protein
VPTRHTCSGKAELICGCKVFGIVVTGMLLAEL